MIRYIKLLFDVLRGRSLFHNFRKDYIDIQTEKNNENWYLILPDDNAEVTKYSLLYIDSFFDYLEYLRSLTALEVGFSLPKNYKMWVFSSNEDVVRRACGFSRRIEKSFLWTEKEIELFIKYYAICVPDNVLFGSFEEPNGRSYSHLIGKRGLDIPRMVAYGIYMISDNFFHKNKLEEVVEGL